MCMHACAYVLYNANHLQQKLLQFYAFCKYAETSINVISTKTRHCASIIRMLGMHQYQILRSELAIFGAIGSVSIIV